MLIEKTSGTHFSLDTGERLEYSMHISHSLHRHQGMLGDIYRKRCIIFGCGNTLFGDDGFGPEVISYLESHYDLPEHVACLDVGTSVQDLLFDILLSKKKPEKVIIVDSSENTGKVPGEISEIRVDQISVEKRADFSVHQFPSMNMLQEIQDLTPIELHVLVVQVSEIPSQVSPGLSVSVANAVPAMCAKIFSIISEEGHD